MKLKEKKFKVYDNANQMMRSFVSIWNFKGSIHIVVEDGDSVETLFYQYDLIEYSGINDIDGKEIYEGDILSQDHHIKEENPDQIFKGRIRGMNDQIVLFHEGAFKVMKSSHSTKYHLSGLLVRRNGLRVVGNTFEKGEQS